MTLVGILLAAGRAERFGGDKLHAALPTDAHGVHAGTPLAVAACQHLRTAVEEVVAVVRASDLRIAESLRAAGARVVICPRADEGMGASLACGVTASRAADGWVVALADMPWIAPSTIAAVAGALSRGASIAAPTYLGARGHPVGFSRRHIDFLRELGGDEGARALLAARRDELTLIEVDDPGTLRDVDWPADLVY